MKRKILCLIDIIMIVAAGTMVGTAANEYSAQDIGQIDDFNPGGINDRGQIVGTSGSELAIWEKGVITKFGTYMSLPTGGSGGLKINDRGQVAGNSDGVASFLWEDGVFTGVPGSLGDVRDINNRGQIIGNDMGIDSGSISFLWQNGVVTVLETILPGGDRGEATAINDKENIVGSSTIDTGGCDPVCSEPKHATLWKKGKITDLGTLPGKNSSIASDINNGGQIAGDSYSISEVGWPWKDQRATLWKNGQIIDLGALPGKSSSVANGINNRGQIVGYSYSVSGDWLQGQRATLWENGKIIDLGILPGGTFSVATGINNRGQIIGYGDTESGWHAILWTR